MGIFYPLLYQMFWMLLLHCSVGVSTTEINKLSIFIAYSDASPSHIKPFLTIGQELYYRGHEVAYAALDDRVKFGFEFNISKVINLSNISYSTGYSVNDQESSPGIRDTVLHLMDHTHGEYSPHVMHKIMNMVMLPNYKRFVSALTQYFISKKDLPDLMLCDFASGGCCDIAQKLGIPLITGIQALDILGIIDAPYLTRGMLATSHITTEGLTLFERLQSQVWSYIQHMRYMVPLKREIDYVKQSMGISLKPTVYGDPSYGVMLANTFFGLEPGVELPPNIKLIGPLPAARKHDNEDSKNNSELYKFLDSHGKLVYIGLGTNVIVNAKEAHTILLVGILAIKEGLIDGFIWGLANSLPEDLPTEVTLPDQTKIFVADLFKNKHPHIRLMTWAPQKAILNHNSTILHIAHGGYGGFIESMQAGKPLLVIPYMGDQLRNAAKVKYMGIGLLTSRFTMTPSSLLEQMNIIIEDSGRKFEYNLKRMQVIANMGQRRLAYAADLVEEHAILAKECRVYQPYNEAEGVPPCEMIHQLPASTRMNFLVANMLDIYLILFLLFLAAMWGLYRFIIILVRRVAQKNQSPSKNSISTNGSTSNTLTKKTN